MTTPLSQRLQHFIPFDEWPESIIEELSPHFRHHQLGARKILFKRGQDDEECHFLLDGSVDLADADFNVNTIRADDDDNFMALDSTHSVHRHTGITQTPCNIVSVKRGYLDLISTWSEFCQHTEDKDDDETDWLERLITSELFARIPPANIQKLLSRFEEISVALGDVIVNEGEIGNHCFVIKTGSALITRRHNEQQETLAALNPGDLFGEDAVVSQMPRNATVTMTGNGTLARLAKDDFDALLKKPILNYLPESKLNTLIDEADTGVIILDVRHSQESSAAPMVRARSVSLSTLRETLKTFERDFIYAIVGGGRAEAAAYILSEAGFDARVVT